MAFEQAFSQHLNSRNREETEPGKKLKKRRSIRVSRGSWFRLSSRSSSKSQINWVPDDLASKSSAGQQPSGASLSDSSSNYMKSTSCFNAKKESSHEEIDFDDVNSLASCASSDIVVLPSIVMSDDAGIPRRPSSSEVSDASPLSLKATRYSQGRKSHIHASPHDSESSYDSSDNGRTPHHAQSKPIHSGHKPTLSRSSSKRGVRIFIKKNSFNPKRTPLKDSQMSEDLNVEKATCSSIIKDSRFPEHVELEPGQTESERISFVKVCPYHHCSLNGHYHDPPPPKKPYLRRRRQSSLPVKIAKSSSTSGPETKRSADRNKGSKEHQMASNPEPLVHEASRPEDANGSKMVPDGLSDPEKNNLEISDRERNSLTQEEDRPEATFELKERSLGFHSQNAEVEKSKAPVHSFGVPKTQFGKGKPISMWHLIHKHMLTGSAAEEETKPLQGADERRQVEEAEMATKRKSFDASPDIGTSNHDKENQDIEIRKLFAIKLVREAVEKILLPEVQDQLSENQSITSDNVEGQEVSEKNHQEAPDEGCKHESATIQVHDDVSITGQEIKKPETKLGKKSDKKSPSNWSNLKKWVLLQRFVKELEKVRKINYKKPREVQLETDPSAEKISLRRQTVDEKKRAEEWMLDYALQQVVSQLAPTQRRKVALLVKAFESVVPPQEDDIQVAAKANVSVLQVDKKLKDDNVTTKPDDWESSVSVEHSKTEKQHIPNEIHLPTDLCLKSDNLRNASSKDVNLDKSQGEISVKELSSFKPEDSDVGSESDSRNAEINVASQRSSAIATKSCDLEVKSEAGGKFLPAKDENTTDDSVKKSELEEHAYTNQRPISELSSGDLLPGTNEIELGDVNYTADEPLKTSQPLMVDTNGEIATTEDLVHSTWEQETSARKERKRETVTESLVVQGFPQVTKTDFKENEAAQSPLDKQNYLNMWHLVCQHVVSSVATKLVLEEDDEETEEANKSSAIEILEQSHEKRNSKAEFSRVQVLKLVKEAVQEILSPEIQDESSDTLSVSSEILPDPELPEKDHIEGAKQSIWDSDGLNKQNTGEFNRSNEGSSLVEEKESTNDVIATKDCKKVESVDESITNPPKQKNWMKLKKLILLKRSIKAMEKARKLKFPEQQLLPLLSDQEPEKVDLRHRMMDERGKAEQWMLDYAVQHIVTKLTPARKKRVAMLVEAFEAVVPLPEM